MPDRPNRSTRLAIAALCCAVAACGPFRRGQAERPVVVFVNQSLDQADVYALSPSGAESRIGTVMPGRTAELTIPPTVVPSSGTVSIVARVLSRSRAPRTGPLTLAEGDRVRVTLPVDETTLTVLPAHTP